MAVDKEKQMKRQNAWRTQQRDKVEICIPLGLKDVWKEEAAKEGLSLTAWIIKKCQGE